MCGMVCTRTDISHVVSVVSRYMKRPGKAHWHTVKWILRYLRGTANVGLMFNKTGGLDSCVVEFVDSNYTGDQDKRRSLIGYVFTLASCAVSWKATLQLQLLCLLLRLNIWQRLRQ